MAATAPYVLQQARFYLNDQNANEPKQRWSDNELYAIMYDGLLKIFEKRPDAWTSATSNLQTVPTSIDGSTTTLPIYDYAVEPLVFFVASRALMSQAGEAINLNQSKFFSDQFKEFITG